MELLPRPERYNQQSFELAINARLDTKNKNLASPIPNPNSPFPIFKKEKTFNVPSQLSFVEESNSNTDISEEEVDSTYLEEQKQKERVAIFIDGSNLFHAAIYLGCEIDYAKLLPCLTKGRQLLRAYFYTACDSTNEKQQAFILWMRRNGYRVVTKELVQFADGSKKANLDVEISVDMLNLARCCDTLVLLSGNGELTYAVNSVTYKGVRVELVSLRSMASESLMNVADSYIDLQNIKPDIEKL
jgi:uncharacterized LabA/DUF88 family protein